jgi:hypothetical protein
VAIKAKNGVHPVKELGLITRIIAAAIQMLDVVIHFVILIISNLN